MTSTNKRSCFLRRQLLFARNSAIAFCPQIAFLHRPQDSHTQPCRSTQPASLRACDVSGKSGRADKAWQRRHPAASQPSMRPSPRRRGSGASRGRTKGDRTSTSMSTAIPGRQLAAQHGRHRCLRPRCRSLGSANARCRLAVHCQQSPSSATEPQLARSSQGPKIAGLRCRDHGQQDL